MQKNELLESEAKGSMMCIMRNSCKSCWCPTCAKRFYARLQKRMKTFNYKTTMHITLTIDPEKYPDPREIYEEIREKRSIANAIRNMQLLKEGIAIDQYLWVLEFHGNEYPHWHLIIELSETDTEIKKNPIFGIISRYWKYGRVDVKKVKSEAHWNNIRRYFEDKQEKDTYYQTVLPDWALDTRVKRFSGSETQGPKIKTTGNDDTKPPDNPNSKTKTGKPRRSPRNHRTTMAECGTTVLRFVYNGTKDVWFRLKENYYNFRRWFPKAKYVEGKGLVVTGVTHVDIIRLMAREGMQFA